LHKALPKRAIFWDGGAIIPGANREADDPALAADPDRARAECSSRSLAARRAKGTF